MTACGPFPLRAALAAALLSACAPLLRTAAAQSVLVTVREQGSGAPVVGGIVSLVDGGGRRAAAALAGEDGVARLDAPRPGRYRVRAERIGYGAAESAPLDVAGDTTRVELALPTTRVQLAGIQIIAMARCRTKKDEGAEVATLWTEARRALLASTLASPTRGVQLHSEQWTRVLDTAGTVLSQESAPIGLSSGGRFRAIPLDSLERHGFVHGDVRLGATYYAPDAEVLLSESFVEHHCMHVVRGRGETAGLVGIAFQPVGRPDKPDVAGTLWLDEASAEVRFLEYRYVGVKLPFEAGRMGGRIDFQRLPTGAWIVREWSMRGPRIGRDAPLWAGRVTRPISDVLVGYTEFGGRTTVLAAEPARPTRARAILTGIVFDSVAGTPLRGARVLVDSLVALADSNGRYRIDLPEPGTYLVKLAHPRATVLGVAERSYPVAVGANRMVTMHLGLPTPRTAYVRFCASEAGADSSSGVAGLLTDAAGAPRTDAPVTVWVSGASGARARAVTVVTDADGVFRACGLPAGRTVRVSPGREPRPDAVAVETARRELRLLALPPAP